MLLEKTKYERFCKNSENKYPLINLRIVVC